MTIRSGARALCILSSKVNVKRYRYIYVYHTFLRLSSPHYCSSSDIQAKITGSQELYIKKGSTISLTCIIELQDLPPSNVTWYHAGAVIDFDGPRYERSMIKLYYTQLAREIIVQIAASYYTHTA